MGAEVPGTMAEAITYADLRFVKAPLKKSNSSQLGHSKDGCSGSLILQLHPPLRPHSHPTDPHPDPTFPLLSRPRN